VTKSGNDSLSGHWFHDAEFLVNLLQFLLSGMHRVAGIIQLRQTQQHGARLNTGT